MWALVLSGNYRGLSDVKDKVLEIELLLAFVGGGHMISS
jgi:hypothetical protein